MVNHAKAFISHSSEDKSLVESIAKHVSAARWEIDSWTFEAGKLSGAEIFQALSRSSLLVLIASSASIESGWVASELEIAQGLLYSKKLGGVIVFIVDDTPVSALPDWIRMHVFARTSNDIRISNIIRARLMQIDSERGILEKPFVQRTRIRSDIEKKLADLDHQVHAIFVSGVDGIGRRAVVTSTLKSLFPGTDVTGIEIAIADGEGLLEAYRKLYFAWRRPTAQEVSSFFEESSVATKEVLVNLTIALLDEIKSKKTAVWFQFDYAILNDDGNFEPAFRDLLGSLKSGRPTVIIRAKREPRFQERRKFNNIAFFKIDSLTPDESKLLWIYALEHFEFEGADAKFISFLQDSIGGHPAMIWTAAEYAASIGKAAIEANPRELLDTLRSLSLSLVDGLNLSNTGKCLLALFDEFGALDPSDLVEICSQSDQEVAAEVSVLLSLGLLESVGDHLQLAAFFGNARFRKQFSIETDAFLSEARQRLLKLTATYTAEDNISFATIQVAVINSIALGRKIPSAFGDRAIVGSHFLRVARASYDREKYKEAVAFSLQALAKRESLTENAIVETLRLLGMAAVRETDKDNVKEAKTQLEKVGTKKSERHIHFITGFEARWNGDYDSAEREFLAVLRDNPKDAHALRELAQILVIREDFSSAEKYAREALARNPGNPFVIDILLQCLIERNKDNSGYLTDDDELSDLFSQLEIADRREKVTFTALRRAHYFSALKNSKEALRWADEAVKVNAGQVHAYAVRAEIKLRITDNAEKLHSVENDIKQIQKIADESKGVRPHARLLAKLRIRFEVAKGNVGSAVKQYEAAAWLLGPLKKKLSFEIATAIMKLEIKDQELVSFANRVLNNRG